VRYKINKSQISLKGENKIDVLESIINDVKGSKQDSRTGKALISFYERKI